MPALLLALVLGIAGSDPAQAFRFDGWPFGRQATQQASGDGVTVALAALSPEARRTWDRIHAGGPFPYAKDGSVFANRERQLPGARRGHYREYTVPTPGARNRGARRIVCGGQPPDRPEACWFTADHYTTFQRIEP